MTRLETRPARPADAAAIASLLGELGYPVDAETARRRMDVALRAPGDAIVLAVCDGAIAGVAAFHAIPLIHEDGFLGRLTALVVSDAWRGYVVSAHRRFLETLTEARLP